MGLFTVYSQSHGLCKPSQPSTMTLTASTSTPTASTNNLVASIIFLAASGITLTASEAKLNEKYLPSACQDRSEHEVSFLKRLNIEQF
jgi:hypothetical protein